jgi:acetyl esterase/lipase
MISDDTLPVDKSRIAMGEFCAGGNLSISVVQLPELRDKIKAIVAFCPILDFLITPEQKLMTRLYKNLGDKD